MTARSRYTRAVVRRWGLIFALACVAAGCGGDDPCAAPAPGVVCSIAGTGEFGFNDDGHAATKTDLYLPSAARRGPDGFIYVMDFNNQRLRRIDENGLVETVVGNGWHAFADLDARPTESPLENPIDFTFMPDGRLVFSSYHDPRVIAVDDDDSLDCLAGSGDLGIEGGEGDGGPALDAQFIQLDGIAVAPDGSIYVSDSRANRVRLVKDGMIETVAGSGTQGYSGDGGPATEAELFWPTALELDAAGNLYIADTYNHAIRRLNTDGTIETVAGTGTAGAGGDGGPATEAQLSQPLGLAFDEDGSLYISDRGNFQVRRIDPDGTIETIAGTGEEGWSGDGGPALEATFGYVSRISLDGDQLLVADQSNALIRAIRLR